MELMLAFMCVNLFTQQNFPMHPIAIIVNLRGLRNEDLQPADNESDIFVDKHVGVVWSYMGA